jgi:hypothetical protein
LIGNATRDNEHRPHRSLDQLAPLTTEALSHPIGRPDPMQLGRNEVLGGLIH